MINSLREWWSEVLADWAFQVAPKDTNNGKKMRELVAAYQDLKN